MTTKLTLSISKEVVEKAKQVSRRKGKSLSKIIEEHLRNISDKEARNGSLMNNINEIMEPYRKNIKVPANGNYKELIRQGRYQDSLNKLKR